MTDAEKKKNLFDDSDEEAAAGGDGEYNPQPSEEQTAVSEPVQEPPKEADKLPLFDDNDGGDYQPQPAEE